jgi:segregation and condensation protein B
LAEFELINQRGIIEALVFAANEPISLARLSRAAELSPKAVEAVIGELNEEYAESGRCFRIENVAGGYKMFTLPQFHKYIVKDANREKTIHLTQASLETLAVVAYKQPVTRSEIERIRGVDCGGVLRNLISKNLVQIEGRSPAPGNPLVYRTSEYFLEFFGLPSLEHLPPLTELSDHEWTALDKASQPRLTIGRAGESDRGEFPSDDMPENTREDDNSENALADSAENLAIDVPPLKNR